MCSIQQLEFFCRVMETRSINKASEQLFVSQPTLSRAIRSMEEELRVELFIRSNRGVRPTEAAERLYRYASRILHQMDLIVDLAEYEPDPSLSFSTQPLLFIAPLLEKYLVSNEKRESQLEIAECSFGDIAANVYNGVSEFGLARYNRAQSHELTSALRKYGLVFTELASDRWMACLGPASPFYRRDSVSIEELSTIPLLRSWDDAMSAALGSLRFGGISFEELQHSHVGSSMLRLQLLRKADCWQIGGLIDQDAAREYDLRLLPISNVNMPVKVGVILKSGHTLSPPAQGFIDFVQSSLSRYT